jgi:ketosteroid isomerase-like protein
MGVDWLHSEEIQEEAMRKVAVVAIAALVLSLAATVTSRTGLASVTAEKATGETLRRVEGEFMRAALERGSAGYMSYYAEVAVELPDGAPAIVGKDNIAKGMGFLDDKNNRLTWSAVGADIASSGDLGYTWGNYEFLSKDKDGNQRVEHGKYTTVWKKQADGSWKVALDMGNKSEAMK